MCRIAGIYDPSSVSLKQDILRMRDSMHRGGPDDAGVYIDADHALSLGQRRLALIDLSSAGHQPMAETQIAPGEDSGVEWLQMVFNGEIYNFLELKRELIALGYHFKSHTDTEVILKAYTQWGKDCFKRFNGMFAVAIWDKRKNVIVLARDHAGIKPLYYYLSGGKLIFASEIRAFKAYNKDWNDNPNWKIPFLCFGHLPEPFTTLDKVVPLEKGCIATVTIPELTIPIDRFHKFSFTSLITDEKEAVRMVREKLEQAVERHLISDAPIGLFLSGGIDSSILTLIAHKYLGDNLKTLSIIFEDADFNEQPYQEMIIKKTGAAHHSFLVTQKEFYQSLPDILAAMDQPSTDGINSYFISKYARESGLTAVLSGVGADELLGGYPSFTDRKITRALNALPSSILQYAEYAPGLKVKRVAALRRKDEIGDYLVQRGFYSPLQTAKLLDLPLKHVDEVLSEIRVQKPEKNMHYFNKASSMETNLYMQNQLLKDTDCMSMWHGLEVRVPFLDKEFMELAYSIAPEVKQSPTRGKHLLIKAFQQELPEAIWNRKKQGFTFPFGRWMKHIGLRERDKNARVFARKFSSDKIHWSRYWCYLLSCNQHHIRYFSENQPKLLFANLTAFSVTGGIEKFNRCFLRALHDIENNNKLIANAVSVHDTEANDAYFPLSNYDGYKGNKVRFLLDTFRRARYYDVVVLGHLNMAMLGLMIKLYYGRKVKVILVTHGIEVWRPLSIIASQCLKRIDHVLAVSNFTKEKIVSLHNIAPDKISVFYNAFDPYFQFPQNFTKPTYLSERYGIQPGEKVVFTLTRLSSTEKYKGYDQVIEAMKKLKDKGIQARYILAGKADEIEIKRIREIIAAHGLESYILMPGFIPDDEVVDHFLLADVFAMPSRKEGFGIVFIEAMATGLHVIAGNQDGSVDALQKGRLGTLVNPDDGEAIFCALQSALNKPLVNGERYDLQQAARECFGFPIYRQRLEKELSKL